MKKKSRRGKEWSKRVKGLMCHISAPSGQCVEGHRSDSLSKRRKKGTPPPLPLDSWLPPVFFLVSGQWPDWTELQCSGDALQMSVQSRSMIYGQAFYHPTRSSVLLRLFLCVCVCVCVCVSWQRLRLCACLHHTEKKKREQEWAHMVG